MEGKKYSTGKGLPYYILQSIAEPYSTVQSIVYIFIMANFFVPVVPVLDTLHGYVILSLLGSAGHHLKKCYIY